MMNHIFHSKYLVIAVVILFIFLISSDVFPQEDASSQQEEIKKLIEEGKEFYDNGEYYKALTKYIRARDLINKWIETEKKNLSEQISKVYLNLAFIYYAINDMEASKENLNQLFKVNPGMEIEEINYPMGFIELYKNIREEHTKPEEEKPAEEEKLEEEAEKKAVEELEKEQVEEAAKKKAVEELEKKKDELKEPEKKKVEKPKKEKEEEVKKEEPEKVKKEKEEPIVKEKPGEEKGKPEKKKFPFLVVGGVLAAGGVAAVLLLGGPGTGTIQVNSTPPGADVYLDGTSKGQVTPCTLSEVSKGSHSVKLLKEGYVDYVKSVEVSGGKTETINADLTVHTINVTEPTGDSFWYKEFEVTIEWATGGGLNAKGNMVYQSGIHSGTNKKGVSSLERSLLNRHNHFQRLKRQGKGMKNNDISEGLQGSQGELTTEQDSSMKRETGRYSTDGKTKGDSEMMQELSRQGLSISSSGFNKSLTTSLNKAQSGVDSLGISRVRIDLYKGKDHVEVIAESIDNSGSFNWRVPEFLEAGTNYKVRVICLGEPDIFGESDKFETKDFVEWVDIPEGSFLMGDNFNEGQPDEQPVHEVNLDGYYISKYEVTFEQYDTFCEETGRTKPSDQGWGRNERPVITVTWHDAKEFCEWVSEKLGEDIHLPTEAQWEKAARGTDQRRYPWGNSEPDSTRANYGENENKTMPVGSYSAGKSFYGVHDMAGNVWEFCQDWYDPDYYKYSPRDNPQGPSNGSDRVIRGGCWWSKWYHIRSALRSYKHPSSIGTKNGFRICKEK